MQDQSSQKHFQLRPRFPIRTIRQTRFGVLTTCKRNWDLRRSRSLSHLDFEDRKAFESRSRYFLEMSSRKSIKNKNRTGSRDEDFDLLIVRPPILSKQFLSPALLNPKSFDQVLKKSKSMVEITGNHEGVVFLSEC